MKNYFLCILGLLPIYFYGLYLGPGASDFLLKEGGIIETLSALGYFVCILYVIFKGRLSFLKEHYYFVVLLLSLGARELDFHNRFTTMSVTKIRFFTSPDVPLTEKLICTLIIFFLAFMVYRIISSHYKTFIDGVKKREVVSIGVLLVFACMVLSKSLDGATRKFKSIGIDISDWSGFAFSAGEEVLELGIPILIFISFYNFFNKARRFGSIKSKR